MQNLYLRGLCLVLCSLLIPAHILAQDDHPQAETYAIWDGIREAWIPTEKIERKTRPDIGWQRTDTYIWDRDKAQWVLAQTLEQWSDANGQDTAQLFQIWRQGADRSWQQVRKQLRYHPQNGEIVSKRTIRENRTGRLTGNWQRRHFNEAGCLIGEANWEWSAENSRFVPRDSIAIERDRHCDELRNAAYQWERNQFRLEELHSYQRVQRGTRERTITLQVHRPAEPETHAVRWVKKQQLNSQGQIRQEVWRQADGPARRDSFSYDREGREIGHWSWERRSDRTPWLPVSLMEQVFTSEGKVSLHEQQSGWDVQSGRWMHLNRVQSSYRPDGQLQQRQRTWGTPRDRQTLYQSFVYRCDGQREMTTQFLDQGSGRAPWKQATFHYGQRAQCDDQTEAPGLAAFPNPSQHQVFLRSPLLQNGKTQIQITDPAGGIRWQGMVQDWHSPVFSIEPGLPPGLYLITVQQGVTRAQTKIQIE